MPDLCDLQDVRTWLGIDDSNTDEDSELSRLITSASLEFMNEIRRQDLFPAGDYTDRLCGNGEHELFLKHYPINSIASVKLNGSALDESDGTITGWFFDTDNPFPEDRQKLIYIGGCWPCSYYRIANLEITYNAGYSTVPEDIVQAVIELVAFKRGFGQLQAQDQTAAWLQLGDYQQNLSTGPTTLKASEVSLPMSVQSVIDRYARTSI